MVRLMRTARRANNDDRGAVLIVAAAAMATFLGMMALVVDVANVHQNRRRAQSTADAAALAAAQELPDYDAAAVAAKEYALRNFGVTEAAWAGCTDSGALAITTAPCISMNASGTEVRVRIPGRGVPSFFAKFLGTDSFAVSAAATAEVEFANTDPAAGFPGDGDPNTPDIRAGDPAGGYPPCASVPDWQADPPSGTPKKWTEFIFVFEHLDGTTTTVCGTSRTAGTGNNTWVAQAGGTSKTNPTGIGMHVSCSDIFANGWTDSTRFSPPMGPLEGIDPEWRVVRYTMDKYKKDKKTGSISFQKRCGQSFTPITSQLPPPPPANIRLFD